MGFHRGPKIVTDGLVLYLDAANTRSYPGTGTTWTDLSSSNKNGTLINGPTFTSSNNGSIVLDGINDYIDIKAPSPLAGTQLFTFEIWVNHTSITGNFGGIRKCAWLLGGGTGTGGFQPELGILSANNTSFTPSLLIFGGGGGTGTGSLNIDISSLIFNGIWHKISLVRTSTNSQIVYLNGLQIGTGNHSLSFNDGDTDFGAIGGNSGYSGYLNGRIGVIKIYNRALTPQEILQNYNATKSRYNL